MQKLTERHEKARFIKGSAVGFDQLPIPDAVIAQLQEFAQVGHGIPSFHATSGLQPSFQAAPAHNQPRQDGEHGGQQPE